MIKKLLSSTLLITGLLLGSFSYGVDSYTCSYENIIDDVANSYGNKSTYYMTNCNFLGDYYDCNVFADVSTTFGYCYQIGGFDLDYLSDININVEIGGNYINFSNSNSNLNQLNGYTVCNPSRFMVQGRVNAYVSDLPFTITTIPEAAITSYSYTYTCPSCDCPTCPECQECQECPSCPSVNTGEILSGYILESEITSGYCEVQFGLISPSDCPNSSGTGDIQWSSFWVNNFQVMGGRNIYLYMPDWLDWDYTYVDENLQIEVENEGDSEYIEGVIENQTTLPNKTDLNNIISGVLPLFIPGLVIILFLYFIFRFIKKIF